MLIQHQHPKNSSISVSVLGAPNVGKSSLVNYLIGRDLSVVTDKAQTTRNRFCCVFTVDRTEVILIDTPGLHRSNQEFNKRMNHQAREGINGAELNLLLVDLSRPINKQIDEFANNLEEQLTSPLWLILTKSDLKKEFSPADSKEVFEYSKKLLPTMDRHFTINSNSGDNIHQLIGAICDVAPNGPHHFSDGSISNKSERFFVTEYIREQAFNLLRDELPHELAVVIDQFEDCTGRPNETKKSKLNAQISATILVNRPSQRAIVIGSKGAIIKKIGMQSRERIEELVGGQIHLNLHVKVSPRWFKNNFVLEELGLPRAPDSNRVWHKK
ncbi:MAG: GTPase Era [Bdellovibrionales bacterium]|jgi:GTPase|nr:GTPase Era [Bdellovibrionales bacterium]MBT3525826.1 GTPase Era [Bdellovibrionales bacterium]MBT7668309.1 GTPase Era [Bdellovibrionales bacterium]MBT7767924.1 GTPase Era [Bdellovibrionales bacterium]